MQTILKSFLFVLLMSNVFSVKAFAKTCSNSLPSEAAFASIPEGSEFDFGDRRLSKDGCSRFAMTYYETIWVSELVFPLPKFKWAQQCKVCDVSKKGEMTFIGKQKVKKIGLDWIMFEPTQEGSITIDCKDDDYSAELGKQNASEVLDELWDRGIKCTPPIIKRGLPRVIDNPL